MKILAVIVNKVPKRCRSCQYNVMRGWHDQLGNLHKCKTCLNTGKVTDPLGFSGRPDWCPLAEEDAKKETE